MQIADATANDSELKIKVKVNGNERSIVLEIRSFPIQINTLKRS